MYMYPEIWYAVKYFKKVLNVHVKNLMKKSKSHYSMISYNDLDMTY